MSKESSNEFQLSDAKTLGNDIRFPSARFSDFVMHYRGTSLRVHKFVLVHHSTYFRTYIEQLVDGKRAYPTKECSDHPSIAHCVHLPDICGKVKASVEDFRLFLCHLYFAQHYSAIPFLAASDVHLTAQSTPAVCLNWPKLSSWQQLKEATPSVILGATAPPAVYESVLSLCHYFDCAAMLSRAEDNMVLVVEAQREADVQRRYKSSPPAEQLYWNELWPCFQLALKFDLRSVDCKS